MAEPKYVRIEALNAITGGDKTFTLALLMKMYVALPIAYQTMNDSVHSQNWAELKAASHKAKSTFAYLDIQEMRTALQEIEHCAMEGQNLRELPEMVETALKLGNEILIELKEVIEGLKG